MFYDLEVHCVCGFRIFRLSCHLAMTKVEIYIVEPVRVDVNIHCRTCQSGCKVFLNHNLMIDLCVLYLHAISPVVMCVCVRLA